MKVLSIPARRRGLILVPAALGVLLGVTSSSALAVPHPVREMPQAQALDASGKPMASVRPILDYCKTSGSNCSFQIDPDQTEQFYTAARSMGNAVINCTNKEIKITRKLELKTRSTDNLGGNITGSAEASGNVSSAAESATNSNTSSEGSFTTPNFEQGPTSTNSGSSQSGNAGSASGSQGASAVFTGGFGVNYFHEWQREQTEETKYELTLAAGDAASFSASHAMQRVNGKLTTGNGATVRNVTVDGPSTVNTSTFIAHTFTVPGDTCRRVRPQNQNDAAAPTRSATEVGQLPAGAQPKGRQVIHPTKKQAPKASKK
ncbi:hypothetical protein ACODT5_02015 [Streptomyces sp. 5.8]|uniref:hypothetical protein n=1 Tax=Streptomyces sp. 5.8 TaxID=3406571 RepID=UPI003BB58970